MNQTSLNQQEIEIMGFESFLTWYLVCRCRQGDDTLPSLDTLKQDYIQYLIDITGNDINAVADILSLPPEHVTRHQFNLWL
ncbi:MAG: hypothetical protein KJ768_05140 [Acidobacteria bacterium]|nr:hypothetical protein [Acidobacteriota bacterium]